jgi:outer membrane protein assembly factor BamB
LFVAGSAVDAAFSSDVMVWALSARSGRLLWQDHVSDPGDFDSAQSLAVLRDRVFVGATVGTSRMVRTYDARSGTLLWSDPITGDGFDLFLGTSAGRVVAASEV